MIEFLGEERSRLEATERVGRVSVSSVISWLELDFIGSLPSICLCSVVRSKVDDIGVETGLGESSLSLLSTAN